LKRTVLFLAALLFGGCCEPQPDPVPAPPPSEPSYCQAPPYAQLDGSGFKTWASPTCSGDIARSEFAVGNNDPLVYRCAQWLPSGEVWCVDPSAPVPAIYFKDPNQNGVCVEWTATSGPWFIWRSCGVQPVYAPAGDEI
jgi:hypothetical protein